MVRLRLRSKLRYVPGTTDKQRRDRFFAILDTKRGDRTWKQVAKDAHISGGDGSIRSMRTGGTRLTRERVIGLAAAVGSPPEDLWDGWPETAPAPNKRAPRSGRKATPTESLTARVERLEEALERAGLLDAAIEGIGDEAQAAAENRRRRRDGQ